MAIVFKVVLLSLSLLLNIPIVVVVLQIDYHVCGVVCN